MAYVSKKDLEQIETMQGHWICCAGTLPGGNNSSNFLSMWYALSQWKTQLLFTVYGTYCYIIHLLETVVNGVSVGKDAWCSANGEAIPSVTVSNRRWAFFLGSFLHIGLDYRLVNLLTFVHIYICETKVILKTVIFAQLLFRKFGIEIFRRLKFRAVDESPFLRKLNVAN